MEPWQITLLVIGIIFLGYVLLFITNIGFVHFFKSTLRKHNKALAVILNTKYDNLSKLINITKKLGETFDEDLLNKFYSLEPKDFAKQYTEKCKDARDILSLLKNQIIYLSSTNPSLEKHNEFQLLKDNVIELDVVYRVNIAMYNADVLGYNYWIRFLPFRYVFLLLKFKEKDLIS